MITNTTLYCPLTPQELKLAKAHRLTLKTNEKFQRLTESKAGDCDDELAAAKEAFREVRVLRRENSHLFTGEYWYQKSGIRVFAQEEMEAKMAELRMQPGTIPNAGAANTTARYSRFDALTNSLTLPWEMHRTSRFHDAFTWLWYASGRGNAGLSHSNQNTNSNTIEFLEHSGVDISRPFSVNGTAFEVVDGAVQTVGYVSRLGMDGLNHLVKRAYAQGLF